MEHHSSVAGRRPGLQVPDVPQAPGHVLVCLCHGGDQFGQTVGYPGPSGHQHGSQKEQGYADGGVDHEHLVLNPSGKAGDFGLTGASGSIKHTEGSDSERSAGLYCVDCSLCRVRLSLIQI